MDLTPTIASSRTELLQSLQDDGTFLDWGRVRVAPIDRFLSNFHRPLQRRMLFSDPSQTLPESGVVKLAASGELFILGESREDTSNGKVIDRLTVLHVVSNASSGRCEYFNYRQDLADPLTSDIGLTSEGYHYLSVEYVSSKSMESGDEAYQGKFLVYGAQDVPFARDGFFKVSGKSYKVIQPFLDSGYSCAVVLQQEDDMVPVVFHVIDSDTSGYNINTGTLDLATMDYTYAGSVDHVRQDTHGFKYYNIYLKVGETPSVISVGTSATLPNQEKVKIVSIVVDNNTQGQVYLQCEGG